MHDNEDLKGYCDDCHQYGPLFLWRGKFLCVSCREESIDYPPPATSTGDIKGTRPGDGSKPGRQSFSPVMR